MDTSYGRGQARPQPPAWMHEGAVAGRAIGSASNGRRTQVCAGPVELVERAANHDRRGGRGEARPWEALQRVRFSGFKVAKMPRAKGSLKDRPALPGHRATRSACRFLAAWTAYICPWGKCQPGMPTPAYRPSPVSAGVAS
jgi:hypothetical protein